MRESNNSVLSIRYSAISGIHESAFPQLRIGQLFENLRSKYGDLYYVEDGKFVEYILKYAREIEGKRIDV